MRAIAVLAVIAYHFGLFGASGGFLGVDLFFVLSGFLITSLLLREQSTTGTIRFRQFWARRLRRLLPASLAMVVAVAVWAWVTLDSISLSSLRLDLLAVMGYAANWRFIASGQSYFGLFTEASPVRHAWSLAIEEQFYMLWPLLTFLVLRNRQRGRDVLLALCVGGIAVSTALMWMLFDATDPSRAYYGTDTRAAQLLVGAVFAVLVARRRAPMRVTIARRVSIAACAAVIVSFFALTDSDEFMYRGGFLVFSVVAGILVVATVDTESGVLHKILTSSPAVYIGRISYGLYLWHWPISIAVSDTRTSLSGVSLALVRLAVTFAVSAVSFRLLENPIRHRTGWANFGARKTVALTASGLTLAASCVIVATAGATAPPKYLTNRQDEVLLTGDTTPTNSSTSGTGSVAPARRILLVGDSLAGSLQEALHDEAVARGVSFRAGTRPGCGMTSGLVTDSNGKLFPWSKICADGTIEYLTNMIMKTTPNVVLWMSSWEVSARMVNDKVLRNSDPLFKEEVMREIDTSVRILGSQGARVVFLTIAPRARTSTIARGSVENADLMKKLNDILVTYANENPQRASILDLARIVCPTTYPCEQEIDGIALRPDDGGHFGPEGSAWVAPRLFDELDAVLASTTTR